MRFVSTIAFKDDPDKYMKELSTASAGVEFSSGGLKHSVENYKLFENYSQEKIIHNYFPGYEMDPFVLNISSLIPEILARSIDHCKYNIMQTAKYASCKFFAVHAGFMLDVVVKDLGNPISNIELRDRDEYMRQFLSSIKELLDYASMHGVDLYLENNVLIEENYSGTLPFFCIESKGINEIFEKFKSYSNFGLLLDTAHLKVSCRTLNLDIDKELEAVAHHIKAIHHSDNDGLRDSNSPIDKSYWFSKYKDRFKHLPQVLEVRALSISQIFNQLELI